MSEAVTVPSLMMMTSTDSEESLARDRHTDRQTDRQTDTCTHTHRLGVVYVKFTNCKQKKNTKKCPVYCPEQKRKKEDVKIER